MAKTVAHLVRVYGCARASQELGDVDVHIRGSLSVCAREQICVCELVCVAVGLCVGPWHDTGVGYCGCGSGHAHVTSPLH